MTDLAQWLAGLGLGKYTSIFAEQEIDFDLLARLTESDVRELGLPIGPRRKLLEAIARLRGEPSQRIDTVQRPSNAEYRQLTVMFVDLANSTPLALQLDPEAMRDVLRAFQETVTAEICRFGYVAKLMGDGVLAYFGWPRAHEDDGGRAVVTALAITEAVARLESPAGGKLACRIGIATGMVVVGDLIGEGAAQEHTVVGPTPNLAARLQDAAAPGEIMIADTTRRLLGPAFAVEAVGERLLKGHSNPVPLFRVLRRSARDSYSANESSGDLGPILGREDELDMLWRAWDDTKAGKLRTVLLTGEAGIGKSRLVQELAQVAANEGAPCHLIQCFALHSDNPFWPVVRRFPSAAAVVERMLDRAYGRDGGQIGHEIVDEVATILRADTDGRPALLMFEDAQWADRATLELVRRLGSTKTPMLLIVTSRPEGEAGLSGVPNLLRVALPRLNGPAARALFATVAGRQLPTRIGNEILARSDGIPLFIEEMTKTAIEGTPAGKISVPATLRDALMARLDVSPTMKAVAQIASCIGNEFSETVLFQIADLPRDELRSGLAALVRVGLLLSLPTGRFRFKHSLLCDVAYESLLTPRRQELHRCIAEALEELPNNLAEHEPESLAHHWFAAGQSDRAEPYWLRARHRIAHWQDQLDALADYLESEAGEVIPFPRAPGHQKPH